MRRLLGALRKLGPARAAGALLAILLAAVFVVPWLTETLGRLELSTIDMRFWLRGPLPKPRDIVVVGVDEETYRELGTSRIGRALYAKALFNLAREGPRAVAVDILFSEPAPGDDLLAKALRRLSGRAVVAAILEARRAGRAVVVEYRPPTEKVKRASQPGVVELPEDADFFVRRARLLHLHQGRPLPSFALATAALAAGIQVARAVREMASEGRFLGRRLPLLPDGSLYINFVGPPGRGFDYVPFYQLVEGSFPRGKFRRKIVLIGATSPASHDVYPTPFSEERRMPGVEIQANAVHTLLSGDFVRPLSGAGRAALSLLLLALCLAAVLKLGVLRGGAVSAALLGLWALVALWAFVKWNLLLPLVAPLVMGATGTAAGVGGLYFSVERKRRQLRRLFERYVSPEVLREITSKPDEVRLGGEEVEATIMFCDLQGFTSLSEGLRPSQVVELLNRYLSKAVEVIKGHGGTVDKFIGDGVMAFFGAPVKHPDHARRAVEAALDLQEALEGEVNPELERMGLPRIRARVGIHTGTVVVGNIGSPDRMEYTAIGDTVNVASRLEGLNKEFGTSIIVGETTFQQLDGAYRARVLGEVKVRGRRKPLKVFSIEGRGGGSG